jgi:hypothetical protein
LLHRLRQSFALVGILSVFLQVNAVGLMYVLYYCNQDILSATVCERKTADCHAKCYLDKQIKNNEEQGSHSSTPERSAHSVAPLFVEYLHQDNEAVAEPSVVGSITITSSVAATSSGVTLQVFNPPRA